MIVVTVIDLEKTNPPIPIVASHNTYYYPSARTGRDEDERLTRVHFGDTYIQDGFEVLSEGLEVDEIPPEDKQSSRPSYLFPKGDGKYLFEHTMVDRPRNDNLLLYHIILPEYCYLDRNEFDNYTEDPIIIVTREQRQTIDCIFRKGKNLQKRLGFKGPDEPKFDSINRKFPKHYFKPGDTFLPF